ncbi:DUF4439 domain-containing protein [Aeromicrobium sp. NPDC092404]|uniref:DUF4439 domain-containing protein n=1 Tax=Aeromicrobium sp. NPDC092404 TaxID=3154976 RepID=UPI00342D804D
MSSTEALQGWLALEHEAVWLYPVIGARFDGVAERARASYGRHRDVRDRLLARLHDMEVEPVATALSYDVNRLRTRSRAITAARQIERDIAAACLTLVGEASGELRTYATAGLRRAALAEITWGAQPKAFPGLP